MIRRDEAARLEAFLPAGVPRRLAAGGDRLAARREITVLFADLTGFTSLCEALSPDAVAELVGGLFDRLTDVVHAHGGLVDKLLGDAVMALFGALDARGDDPACAARAALEIVDVVRAFDAERPGGPTGLRVSVGLHTGPAFVGVVGRTQRTFTALGDTVNTAARLEKLAAPGEVVCGSSTAARLPDDLVAEPMEAVALKGKAREVRPSRLRRAGGTLERSALVGRDAVLGEVRRGLAGSGAVLVAGPPGSGRSAVLGAASARAGRVVAAAGRPGLPPGDLLRRLVDAAGLLAGEAPADEASGFAGLPADASPADAPSAGALSPDALALLLGRRLAVLAAEGPLLVATDDLDLASPADRGLLARAVARARGAGAHWLAAAARPDLELPAGASVARVELPPLDLDAARRLLEARLEADGGPALPAADLEQVARAVGLVPGALVEAARILAAAGPAAARGLPTDLDALVLARLDRLPATARALLDRLAIRAEASRLAGLDATIDADAPGAEALVRAGVVRAAGGRLVAAEPAALRAVLGGLDAASRRALHAKMARDRRVPGPVRLAHHARAGTRSAPRAACALGAWQLSRGHAGAALASATAGLVLLAKATPARRAHLGPALHLLRGEARARTGDLNGAAESFEAAASGGGRAAVRAEREMARLLWMRGELSAADALAERAGRAAAAAGWTALAAASRVIRGNVAFEEGELGVAEGHYRAALVLAEPADPRLARRIRMNLGALAAAEGRPGDALAAFEALLPEAVGDAELAAQLGHDAAMALAALGRTEEADRAYAAAAASADALGDLRLAAMVRAERAALLLEAGDPERARAAAAEAMERFAIVDDRLGLGDAYKLAGLAESRLGCERAAIAWLERAVELLGAGGAALSLAEALVALADVEDRAGAPHLAAAARRRAGRLRREAGLEDEAGLGGGARVAADPIVPGDPPAGPATA